jgi:hypothetical protein
MGVLENGLGDAALRERERLEGLRAAARENPFDGEKARRVEEALGYMRVGMRAEDAAALAGLDVADLPAQKSASESLKLEKELLSLVHICARDCADGGKANPYPAQWMLERLWPNKYGGKGGQEGSTPVNIIVQGSGVNDPRVEVHGKPGGLPGTSGYPVPSVETQSGDAPFGDLPPCRNPLAERVRADGDGLIHAGRETFE